MGNLNAKIGTTVNDDHIRQVLSRYGLGDRNERDERLIQFCIDNSLAIANSMYEQHKRRLYTWRSPDGNTRNQIDYILIRQRWKSSIRSTKTIPSVECGSDHQLLMCEYAAKLKVCKRRQIKRLPQLNADQTESFNESTMRRIGEFAAEIEDGGPEAIWKILKNAIVTSLKELPEGNRINYRQHWLSTGTKRLIEERRELKTRGLDKDINLERFQSLNRDIQTATRRDKNQYLSNICKEIQEHAVTNDSKDLFKRSGLSLENSNQSIERLKINKVT